MICAVKRKPIGDGQDATLHSLSMDLLNEVSDLPALKFVAKPTPLGILAAPFLRFGLCFVRIDIGRGRGRHDMLDFNQVHPTNSLSY